jgi:hypothetical protein
MDCGIVLWVVFVISIDAATHCRAAPLRRPERYRVGSTRSNGRCSRLTLARCRETKRLLLLLLLLLLALSLHFLGTHQFIESKDFVHEAHL